MIKIRRKCKEIERKSFRAKTGKKQGKNRGLRDFAASAKSALCCETTFGTRVPLRSTGVPILQLRNDYEPLKHERSYFRRESSILQRISQLRSHFLAHECHFAAQWTSFRNCETTTKSQSVKTSNFAVKAPFRRVFRSCETTFWHTSAILQPCTLILELRNHFWAAKWLQNDLQA